MAEESEKTYVVANNHYKGKAAANALELKAMLTGSKVRAPRELVKHFPNLASLTATA
jgi:uncharacterized protein YecE (DUF72 family)